MPLYMIERAFAEEYGFGAPPRVSRTVIAMTRDKLGEFVGRYAGPGPTPTADSLKLDVSIPTDGKMLMVYNSASKRSLPIAPTGGNEFVGLEGGGTWQFERSAEGKITAIANGTGPNRRILAKQP